MHILFLTDNFPPEVNAPASRTFEHCREWVKLGEQVTVITCAPNFPKGKVFPGYKNRLCQTETIEGIRVIRVWSYITANEGFVRRSLDYISFMVAATIASLFTKKVDVVIGTSPQFFTVCAAYVVGLLKRVPWIFELRDIWPESIKAVGSMKDGVLYRSLEKLELFLYRKANRVISLTQSFKVELVSRGISAEKIDVITNGVDLSLFKPRSKNQALLKQLGLENKFVAGYIGTIGMAHGLETLVEAAEILQGIPAAINIHFLVLGDGARKGVIKELASQKKLKNIAFIDTVPKSEVGDYWSLLDVSIIHLKKDPLFEKVIPSKLFECMGMGIPVLHGVLGESAEIVNRLGVGKTVPPENPKELALELMTLPVNSASLGQMRRAALNSAGAFERRQLALNMLQILQHHLAGHSGRGKA
ncbi:glycosyltransferase family 4 protein [Polynucleobacter sp. AP-Kaivos-20-H2]|uniref:glycosyltransferase family 4 protein n=1 Tax=Polynucleobacter sp. AP-Kaivos-20-H2 TaxID=2689104 RepID=UPI001C0C4F71|nr:glycosyltransferase family 4 protein [Polynucleobacter sp. AP-Kaivos-20-H2]